MLPDDIGKGRREGIESSDAGKGKVRKRTEEKGK